MTTTLFIETDIHDDVDDVGALAVAQALSQAGRVRLGGVNVNTRSVWGPRLVAAINDYYGQPVPIGALHPPTETLGSQEFVRGTTRLFGWDRPVPTADPVRLLRSVLATAGPSEVTVASLGFFDNLVGLLRSGPDELSALDGRDLVRRSVDRIVVMGGAFGGARPPGPGGGEYNFAEDPALTAEFLGAWPGRVDFVGWEVGHEVISGRRVLESHGRESPVATAYQLHSGFGNGRPSWDPIAVLLAVDPAWPAFAWSEAGVVSVDAEAASSWAPASAGSHRYAVRTAAATDVADTIDHWLCRPSGTVTGADRLRADAASA